MRFFTAALALLPVLAAAEPAYPVNRAALVAEHSDLDKGQPDWSAVTVQLGRHWSNRQLLEAELTRTRRFGVKDDEIALGGALPLSETLTGSLRASHSPTHRVLPRDSITGAVQWEFRRAWLLHGGLRSTRYVDVQVREAGVQLEHYFGDFGAQAGVKSVRAFGQTNYLLELRGAWYYADASSIGVIASDGDEAVQVAPGNVALAHVRSLALVGKHRFGAGPWSLRYGLHHVRQGDFYTRRGGSLGVQLDF
jgi:YaiO family outer membrane protein